MFMFDFNAAKPQRGFGPHPGPAPKWRPYGEFYRFHACEHTQRKPVWRVYGDGTRRYGFQCLDCGDWGMRDGKIHGTQHWLGPKKFWAETRINPYGSEPADESFRDTRRAEITRAARKAWWEWYDKYLASAEWDKRRIQVLERDGHRCVRCSSSAEHIHHLTYDNVGYESIDELVSLCRDCHDVVHDRQPVRDWFANSCADFPE